MLSHHYRYPWECFPEDLHIAAEQADVLQQLRKQIGDELHGEHTMLRNRFVSAMDADLNTPEAVLLLRHAAKDALKNQDSNLGSEVLRLTQVLGLRA